MNVKPNINLRDVDQFVADIWRAGVELYINAELYPTWRDWYQNPDCTIPGCGICNVDWGI